MSPKSTGVRKSGSRVLSRKDPLDTRVTVASLVAFLLLATAFCSAQATPGTCSGGASLSGWYGMLVSGGGEYLSGALYFDGNCNVSGNHVTGGSGGQYSSTSVSGTYVQNSDGTFTITLNYPGQSTPQTYMVGVSESGNKARGLESDGTVMATIDLQSQLTTLTSGYGAPSLSGTYAASCYGSGYSELDYVTFDGKGNISGVDANDIWGSLGNQPVAGTYSVNSDGTFSGSLAGSYSFNGVIDNGVSEIEYTYDQSGTGGVMACVGKQSSSAAANLRGNYGIVVGGTAQSGWGGEYLSGSVYFDGVGGLSGANVNGGLGQQYVNTSVAGSYAVNSNNTISITMNLAGQSTPQTFVVAVSESGDEAAGIETDGTAIATIDMQNQIWPSTTPPYSNASLNGTYAASCSGAEVDLNYVTFDGNGNITAGVDAYDDGWYGDNPYTGTYTVNSDGTFSGNFPGPIYDIFTMTGVIDNGTAEIEYTYDQSGVGGVVACVGESSYGPIGTNPAVATPTFSPAPGAYGLAQSVTLADTTPGAVIYYTTNGTAPTIQSAVYTGPIQISATTTIQAIAVASDSNNSAIAAGTYFYGPTQSLTFPPIPTQTYPTGPIVLSATASSGLPIKYTVLSGPATVNGNILTITGAGSGTVQASQAGNAQFFSAAPVSQTLTVNMASTALMLTSNSNPALLNQPVTIAATIMPQNGGQASGTITFEDSATILAVVAVTGNVATLTVGSFAVGVHSISAVYSGDANFLGSTATPLVQIVSKAPTTTTLASSNALVDSGRAITLTISVSSPMVTPTGRVQVLDGTTVLAQLTLKAGAARYSTRALPAGSTSITAVYLGDSNNSGSTSAPVNEFVLARSVITLTSSPNPSAFGQTVMFTATITSSIGAPPDGEIVTFNQGGTTLGTGTLSGGKATFSTSALGVGTKAVTAVYGGDANFAAGTSMAAHQVVSKAATTTTVTSSINPSSAGKNVEFTAVVTAPFGGIATGTVTFYDGTTTLGTVATSGAKASLTTSKLSHGTHHVTATYNSSADFAGSSGSLTQTVN